MTKSRKNIPYLKDIKEIVIVVVVVYVLWIIIKSLFF